MYFCSAVLMYFRSGVDNFAEHAVLPMILALGPTHVRAKNPALAQFAGDNRAAKTFRADPSGEMLRFCPAFKNQLARRVENALDYEFSLGRLVMTALLLAAILLLHNS